MYLEVFPLGLFFVILLHIASGSTDILIILIHFHKHGIAFIFIFFFDYLHQYFIAVYKSFYLLGWFLFYIFDALINRIVFLTSFSDILFAFVKLLTFVCWFWTLKLYFIHLSVLIGFFVENLSTYRIMSSSER